jgi:hypothetical protein
MILDDKGLARVVDGVRRKFPDQAPDIICIDPIRNLFDSGEDGGGENDNAAMMFFLTERIERLREAVAPNCGLILAHHTKKMNRKAVGEDPFQALSGASALRGYYTSGLLLHPPDEESPRRRLEFELRNGPALDAKLIEKHNDRWVEINPMNERLVRAEADAKNDAERNRKNDVIVNLLRDEALRGRVYNITQFAEKFENTGGLGGQSVIKSRIGVLATKGYIKFIRGQSAEDIGLSSERSKFGYLCVEDMKFATGGEVIEPTTGEIIHELVPVLPSHFKCPQTGAVLPVENPNVWVYQDQHRT